MLRNDDMTLKPYNDKFVTLLYQLQTLSHEVEDIMLVIHNIMLHLGLPCSPIGDHLINGKGKHVDWKAQISRILDGKD